jgi:hypothetical protein
MLFFVLETIFLQGISFHRLKQLPHNLIISSVLALPNSKDKALVLRQDSTDDDQVSTYLTL